MKIDVIIKLFIYNVLYKKLGFGTFYHFYDLRFNKMVRMQRKNHLEIPFIINNFNQLFYLKQLVSFLLKSGFKNIIIIDNNSSYSPLLEYYEYLESNGEVIVKKLNGNLGHRALYSQNKIMKMYCKGYYFLSDADCVPYPELPYDFPSKMIDLLDKYFLKISKVGLALNLEDIPNHYKLKDQVLKWERRFSKNQIEQDVYEVPVDTTFALYKPSYGLRLVRSPFLNGLRLAGKYKIKHGGWYEDTNNPSEEHLYYQKTASTVGSWIQEEKKSS